MKLFQWIREHQGATVTDPTPEPVAPVETQLPDIDTCYRGVAVNDYLVSQENLREAKAKAAIAETELSRVQMTMRPSRTHHCALSHDGLQWVLRLVTSDNSRSELVGVGDTPEKATLDFDYKWYGIEK